MPEERDIGAELYELIRTDFERFLDEESPDLPDMSVANMKQADSYAHTVGWCLALAIAEHVKPEVLPDGRLYYNIAEKILDPTLRENHRLVNEFCGEIQKLINERQGINIRPQTAKYPEERAHSLINAAAHEEDWDKTERILDDSVRTLTDSFYADNVKANADLRSKAGLRVEIVREGGSKCCPWCADLAGRYAYPDEVPKDVYRRHDNCTCSVTYVNGRARQNVWTKAQWQTPAERAERIALAKNKAKPTVFTKEQASAIRERGGGLTNRAKSVKVEGGFKESTVISEDIKIGIEKAIEKVCKEYNVKVGKYSFEDISKQFGKVPFQFVPIDNSGKYNSKFIINSGFNWEKDLDSMNERIYQRNYKRGILASKNIEDLIYHEMAHFMCFQTCDDYYDFISLERQLRREFRAGVSGYSDQSEDGSETIAEAFVRIKNKEDVSNDVKKLVEFYVERWRK